MGVSFFFPWITTRYPKILHNYNQEALPVIDHLYLDINGVLHICSKNQSALYKDILCGKEIQTIFIEIINYLNMIINKVKPRKSIIIAIDGVCPKSKMLNQRDRRFHVSKNTEELTNFLVHNLNINPGVINFKSNSISPGTEFMQALNKNVEFFIQKKIEQDPSWQNLQVFFTSGNVPGEGEHKIFQHIREWKQSSDYHPDDTHCVYGNDSDLILLGLISHLKNIVILREQHEWGGSEVINSGTCRQQKPIKYELIFISLLREYFELEYKELLNDKFCLEKIIDDFLLLSLFMGNDFIPQLYCMNVKAGNFDLVIQNLKIYYEKYQQYLTNKYEIQWGNFIQFIELILPLEKKMILNTLSDFNYQIKQLEYKKIYKDFLKEKNEVKPKINRKKQPKYKNSNDPKNETKEENKNDPKEEIKSDPKEEIKNELIEETKNELKSEPKQEIKIQSKNEIQKEHNNEPINQPQTDNQQINEEQINKDTNKEDQKLINQIHFKEQKNKKYILEFQEQYQQLTKARDKINMQLLNYNDRELYKEKYYQSYFDIKKEDQENFCEKLVIKYAEGMQFILKYYHIGCPSWEWYFEYVLPPLISDFHMIIKILQQAKKINFTFDDSKPTSPYEQLLFILPRNSLNLLPKALEEEIMKEENGISQYYHNNFKVIPYDRIKDYTWKPDIEIIEIQKVRDFLTKFDWSKLSSQLLDRNKQDVKYLYLYNENEKFEIIPTTKGFEKTIGPIKKIPIDQQFDIQKYFQEEYYTQSSVKKMPTFSIFKFLKLVTIQKKRKREQFYLLLTQKTVKKYWEYFNQKLKMLQGMTKGKINLVYQHPFVSISKKYLDSYKINRQSQNYNFQVNRLKQVFEKQFMLFEQQDIFESIKALNLIDICDVIYQKFQYNNQNHGQVQILGNDQNYETITFLEVFFNPIYPIFKQYDFKLKKEYYNNSQVIDLLTGNLFQTKKYNHHTPSKNLQIIRQNTQVQNIGINKEKEEIFLVTEQLINQLGLRKEEKLILWLILDKFEIDTSKKEHNSMILGDVFDIGLNFMNIINKKVEGWKIVNDLIKLQLYVQEQQLDESNPIIYECPIQKTRKKNYKYLIFLTKKAIDAIQYYINEFKFLIDFLIKQNDQNQLMIDDKNALILNNRFKIDNILQNSDDKNQELFKIYAKILVMETSSLSLHSNLSIIFNKETLKNIKNNNQENQEIQKVQSSYFLIKNQPQKQIVWPQLIENPKYHKLGDRICVVNNFHKHIQFGELGTVIGIYKDQIEVLFDRAIIGANDLNGRVEYFRGDLLNFFDIFNLSQWKEFLSNKMSEQNWCGEFDLFGLFSLIKQEQIKFMEEKQYQTKLQQLNIKIILISFKKQIFLIQCILLQIKVFYKEFIFLLISFQDKLLSINKN